MSDMDPNWTLGSLYAHFKELRNSDLENLRERFETQTKRAEDVATSVAARFLTGNEFRDSLKDASIMAARTLMPRTEAEAEFKSLRDKVESALKENVGSIRALEKQFDDRASKLERDLSALTTRIGTGEGTTKGGQAVRDETRLIVSNIIGWVIAAAAVVFSFFTKRG